MHENGKRYLSIAQTVISIQSIEITDDNDDHDHNPKWCTEVSTYIYIYSIVLGGFGIQLQTLAIIQITSHHHRRHHQCTWLTNWTSQREINAKKKENWFQCENGTTKSEPLHIVVRALYLDLDMKLVIFDGTSRQSRQNTIHNIDGNIRSKCALYPCVLTRVLTTQPHVRSAKKMDRERESKKISMNCFSGFYCCQIRILLNAFRNRSNSSQRWRLKNVIVSLSLAKEVRLNRAQWLLSISGWVCV